VAGVQARLLCNLFDGMVAVEGGRGGPTGALWNELPDRVADSVLLIALGMAGGNAVLGWAAALMAALTAYVRATGGALGLGQDFSGLQSKPKRMFVMTVACLVAAAAPWWPPASKGLLLGAWIITLGSALTAMGRTQRLAKQLRERAAAKP
jgi:phosphatidylglycerophosphate synthase